jgi:two-component system response regulator
MKADKKTILLVEDNPDDVELTLRALKKNNIANKVEIVKDGAEALDYLFCRGRYADRSNVNLVLVLLDLKLPKVDGFEVLEQIRADDKLKVLPVVVLTSSKEQQDLIDSYKMQVNSYIRKPIDFDQFIEIVKNLGLYWLVLNEPPPEI